MDEELREGYYKDKYGRWQKDRRKADDRRRHAAEPFAREHRHRKVARRKADRDRLEYDHRVMVDEALEEFAADHDGHL